MKEEVEAAVRDALEELRRASGRGTLSQEPTAGLMHALSSAGKSWAIATPHWAATDIGASSFREGGNAVDAALASGVALAVAYPHNCSAGGDLFALVKRPTGDVIAINASGAAPAALTIDGVPTGDGWPERGPFTVTVPGVVGGWQALSAQGARLGFRHGFERAIGLAADGLPVARSLATAISDERDILLRDPGCARYLLSERSTSARGR